MITLIDGILIVGATIILSLAGMLLVRRSVSLSTLEAHHGVAGAAYATIGVMYSIMLTFVVVAVWQQYNDADNHATQEANALVDLYYLTDALPEAERQRFQQTLLAYARVVVDEEWSTMSRGEASPRAVALITDLWQGYVRFEAKTAHHEALHAESLRRMDEMGEARRLRILDSRLTLPAVLWVVLIAGAVITVGFSYFFGVKSLAAQTLMTAALSVLIGMLLLLTYEFDNPFKGDTRVNPTAFELVLDQLAGTGR